MQKESKIFIRTEQTESGKKKLSKVIEYESGKRVQMPINRDGSVKWYDDSRLIRK